MKDFTDKVIIITGASSGIGKELAIKLSEKGALLSLAARNEIKLKEVAEKCKLKSKTVLTVTTDVSKKEQCKNLIEETINKFGKIDILINNAGITMWTMFEDITDIDLVEKIMLATQSDPNMTD